MYFIISVNRWKSNGIYIYLIGILGNAVVNKLRLLTMSDLQAPGANHIVQ